MNLASFAERGVVSASAWAKANAHMCSQSNKLTSGVKELDDYLLGGLPYGAMSEWGCPLGRGGREAIRAFIAAATHAEGDQQLVLWVSDARSGVVVYPPSWFAHGVNLTRAYFTACEKPVTQLKPVFFSPLFKVIVLDAPKELSRDDLAFLARQARSNSQIIIVIRNYLLSQERGNVWAKFRLNCWQSSGPNSFTMVAVRGLKKTRISFVLPERQELT
jgi:hypothetical protein